MGHLVLRFPDSSEAPLTAAATHGRGTHASLDDVFLSREHLSLTPVLGAGDVVLLKNLGRNRECAAPAAAAHVYDAWMLLNTALHMWG